MPAKSEFRSVMKYCLVCDKLLTLRNNRDINRKKFCNRSCLLRHYSPSMSRMLGHGHSDGTKKKISLATAGSNNPRYKPLRDLIIRPMSSFEGRQWRASIFARDDYICQVCGDRGGRLHAHHIKSYKHYPDLRYEVSNGQTLCVGCHKETNTYGWRAINVTS